MIAFINAVYDGGSNGSRCFNRSNRRTPNNVWNASEASKSNCEGSRIVHTVGHSTRTIDDLIELLNAHRFELVIDVRRWPMSRRYPHFNRETLAQSLQDISIGYIWRQDLGGFRKPAADSPNTAWRVATFRAYADYMLTSPFATIIEELESLAASQRITLMCAEAVHWRCHRQLIADAFLVRGWNVQHIRNDGCHEHKLPSFAQIEGIKIIYSESPVVNPNYRLF